jgi:hypothetical protein
MAGQPARLRPRRAGRLLRRAGREALPRRPAVPLDPPEGRADFDAHVRPGQVAARASWPGWPRARAAGAQRARSADGTVKWLFDVGGGNAVETVFIPEADRGTLCVSSQAGCAVGCRFCSTGHQGFSRNLAPARSSPSSGFAEHRLRSACGLAAGERAIDNVVMMGMGEPLQNYAALVPALR